MAGVGLSRLLLIGGGHSHLFVLEALATGRIKTAEAVLVSPDARQLYSGMLPGYLGGRHTLDQLTFDLAALAAAVGVRYLPGRVERIDAFGRTVTLADGTTLPYDVASVGIGGVPAGHALPGVAAHALFLKPADRALLIGPAFERAAAAAGPEPLQVAVVGAGAAGVELALAARARLDQLEASRAVITIYESSHTILRDHGTTVAERAEAVLRSRDITLRLSTRVEEVGPNHVVASGGRVAPADLILWATGTEAPPLFRASGLPTDSRGFLSVDDALTVPGCPGLFGAGDAVTLLSAPRLPHAGVHAVRQGPVLARNLAAALAGTGGFRNFRPRTESLALLNTADGRALGSWRGLALHSGAVLAVKDRIDRRFMRRFQRLARGTAQGRQP